MYTYKRTNLKKSTIQFNIIVPKEDVAKYYKSALKTLAETVEIEGFRKGKAPIHIAEKSISSEKIYDKAIQNFLPETYKEIVKKESIQPITQPQVELKKAKHNQDWEIELKVALRPTIKLPDYKKIVKDVKATLKKDDIWVPGKDDKKKPSENQDKTNQLLLNNILSELIKKSSVDVSDLIIDKEVDVRLTQLVDDVRGIGLTIESYLKSKKLTLDVIKEQFKKEIVETYILEFVINDIADKENITVEDNDIKKFFSDIKDENTRKQAEQNAYYYTMMLRKQKVIDYLTNL